MVKFQFKIKDLLGIHARPATALVKEALKYKSQIFIIKDDKSILATKLMALMSLGIKQGETISVEVNGVDEEVAAKAIQTFLQDNL